MGRTSNGWNRWPMNNTASRSPSWRRLHVLAVVSASVMSSACNHLERTDRMQSPESLADMKSATPALARYTTHTLFDGVWKRPGLSARDRSIATVSVLIARNQSGEMPFHFRFALDNGVRPAELSEIIAHLAFYSGWANATAAAAIASHVFEDRGIDASQIPAADVALLPLDEAAEKQRAQTVDANFGAVSPGVVQYTTDVLFRDLWLRPALAPRDRSLVTVSALVANGQVAQIPYHLNRAMDNGLTKTEASEVLTQLAFYAGWPNVFSAMPVFKDVASKRGL